MQTLEPHTGPAPRRSWWRVAQRVLAVTLVVLLGLLVAGYVRLLGQAGGAYTGDRTARRPGASRFAPPFRLLGRVNVLFIGADQSLDQRRQVLPFSRSDTLMLLSFDPRERRVFAFSIPRDTRALIPGHGETKINAALAYGGPRLTIQTVEGFLGVPIQYYVRMRAEGFAALINALGGLEIDVEKDMYYVDHWAGLKIDLKKGPQWLNGQQAMGYARFRKDALGDIGRVRRQQQVLRALIGRLRENGTILKTPALMEVVRKHTETNLSPQELLALGWFTRFVAADWEMSTLPGGFGHSYWEPDWPRIRKVVAEYFYGVTPDALAGTRVEVLNASGVPGIARRAAERLQRLGVVVARVDTAPREQDASQVIAHRGSPGVADLIAQMLGLGAASPSAEASDVDVTVIVARDYVTRAASLNR